MQRTPAGLPFGMPGIGDEIEGAVQQAPQPGRQDGSDMLSFCRMREIVVMIQCKWGDFEQFYKALLAGTP
jgi:hypothetical protein